MIVTFSHKKQKMLLFLFLCFSRSIDSFVREEVVESEGGPLLQVTMLSQGDKSYNFSEYNIIKLSFQDTDGVVVLFNQIGYEYTFHFGENNSEIISREKIYYLSHQSDFIRVRKIFNEDIPDFELSDLQISFKPDFKQDSTIGIVTTNPIPAFYMTSHSRGESINHTIADGESISYFNASPYLRKSYIEYYFTNSKAIKIDTGDGNGEVSSEETNMLFTDWHNSFFFHVSEAEESEYPMIIYTILSMPQVNDQFTQNSANLSSFRSGPYPMERICTIFRTKQAYVCLGEASCDRCPEGYELIRSNELHIALSIYVEESGDREVSVVYDGYGVGYFNCQFLQWCDISISSLNPEIIIDFDFVDSHLASLVAVDSTIRRITSRGTEYEIINIDNLVLTNSVLTSIEAPISIVVDRIVTDFSAIQHIASLSVYQYIEFTGYFPYIEGDFPCKLSVSREATLVLPCTIKYIQVSDDFFVIFKNKSTEMSIYSKHVQIKGAEDFVIEGSMIEDSNPMTITVYNASTKVKGHFSNDTLFIFDNVNNLKLLTPINFTIKEDAIITVTTDVLLSNAFRTSYSTVITETGESISRIFLTNNGYYIFGKNDGSNYVYIEPTVSLILHHTSVNTLLSIYPEKNPTEIPNLTVYPHNNSHILFERGWVNYHGKHNIKLVIDPHSNYNFTSYDEEAPSCIEITNINGTEYDVSNYVSTIMKPTSPIAPVNNNEQIIIIVCIVLSVLIVLIFLLLLFVTPLGSVCGINTYQYCCFKSYGLPKTDMTDPIDPTNREI